MLVAWRRDRGHHVTPSALHHPPVEPLPHPVEQVGVCLVLPLLVVLLQVYHCVRREGERFVQALCKTSLSERRTGREGQILIWLN